MRLYAGAVVLCLGHVLYPNGSMSWTLMNRCQTALDIARKASPAGTFNSSSETGLSAEPEESSMSTIVVSGGQVERSAGMTEAQAMLEYISSLLHQPCPATQVSPSSSSGYESYRLHPFLRVIKETESRNTVENLLNCRQIFRSLTPRPQLLHLVTSDYHMPRSLLLTRHILRTKYDYPIECIACPSVSYNWCSTPEMSAPLYRPLEERPKDADMWYFSERLDWELNGIQRMNNFIAQKYMLPPIPDDEIDAAIHELRRLNETYINDVNLRHKKLQAQ